MTGEGSADPHWNELRAIQPGGRAPAPGELALVQSFINSHYDLEVEHGRDLFATPAALASWIACHDPLAGSAVEAQLTDEDLRRALAVREGLRGLASSNGGAGQTHGDRADSALAAGLERLNEAARGAAVELRLTQSQPRFVPVASRPLDRVLAAVLAAAATAIIDGRWARLKVCPGDHCGWAFFDHSRNQSGRWCSMSVCGGRAKARAHYHRRRGEVRRGGES